MATTRGAHPIHGRGSTELQSPRGAVRISTPAGVAREKHRR